MRPPTKKNNILRHSDRKYLFIFLTLAFLCFGAQIRQAHASIARVHYYQADPANSVTVVTSTPGDFLVVAYSYNATGQSASISDTQGNIWNLAGSAESDSSMRSGSTNVTIDVWYAMNIVGGNSDVISVTGEDDNSITATEYSGVALSNAFDASASAIGSMLVYSGSPTPATVGPMSASPSDEIFSALLDEDGYGLGITWGSPFTLIHTNAYHVDSQADAPNLPSGSISATVNGKGDDYWVMVMFGFKQGIDIIPPIVSWVSPSGNPTVSSTITLTASSTDNASVASVAF